MMPHSCECDQPVQDYVCVVPDVSQLSLSGMTTFSQCFLSTANIVTIFLLLCCLVQQGPTKTKLNYLKGQICMWSRLQKPSTVLLYWIVSPFIGERKTQAFIRSQITEQKLPQYYIKTTLNTDYTSYFSIDTRPGLDKI